MTWRKAAVPDGGQVLFSRLSPHLTSVIELSTDKQKRLLFLMKLYMGDESHFTRPPLCCFTGQQKSLPMVSTSAPEGRTCPSP